ncbi:MAG: 1-phosphofructokinase family hexose kinase [Anaerolineales bacterium]|jgi:1-phosphofructokinase family hexose kinase
MIVTLTPNTAIDRTFFIPAWTPNRAIRASHSALGPGGKGIDASWILAEMGRPSLALGFAAGPTGRQLEGLLKTKGVIPDFTWVEGETRTNIVLVCGDGSGQSTISADTLELKEADTATLIDRYHRALEGASCVAAGGTLPTGLNADFYAERAQEARDRRIPFILDAEGAPLAKGLAGHPTIVKPNRHELETLVGRRLSTMQEVYEACEQVRDQTQGWVVVSLGPRGGLAVLGDRVLRVQVPPVPVVNTAGAGDGILAGLALALSNQSSPEDSLRQGFAAAAAVVETEATADCRYEDIRKMLEIVEVKPFLLQKEGEEPVEDGR